MSRADKYIVKTIGVAAPARCNWTEVRTETEHADAALALSAVASALVNPLVNYIEILSPDRTPPEPCTMFTEFDHECIPGN